MAKPLKTEPEPGIPADEKNRETLRGAKALARALVRHSIETVRLARLTLLNGARPSKKRREALREIAGEVEWMTASDNWPLGFEAICSALRFNPSLIRRQVAAELNTVPGDGLRELVDRLNG